MFSSNHMAAVPVPALHNNKQYRIRKCRQATYHQHETQKNGSTKAHSCPLVSFPFFLHWICVHGYIVERHFTVSWSQLPTSIGFHAWFHLFCCINYLARGGLKHDGRVSSQEGEGNRLTNWSRISNWQVGLVQQFRAVSAVQSNVAGVCGVEYHEICGYVLFALIMLLILILPLTLPHLRPLGSGPFLMTGLWREFVHSSLVVWANSQTHARLHRQNSCMPSAQRLGWMKKWPKTEPEIFLTKVGGGGNIQNT